MTEITLNQLFGVGDITHLGVVGSREWPNRQFVFDRVDALREEYPMINTIVSGGQPKGVDGWAKSYALMNDLGYIEHIPAHWYPEDDERYEPYGVNNYFDRNTLIARDSHVLAAFCYQGSDGTMDTYKKAQARIGRRAYLYTEEDLRG